jgi:hypothetical protein
MSGITDFRGDYAFLSNFATLGDMTEFGIKPVPIYLMSDVFPQFQSVMRKLTRADMWGAGKSRFGGTN